MMTTNESGRLVECQDEFLKHTNPKKIFSGEDLINSGFEEMDWLVENLIPRTGIGSVVGGSDLGKSAMLRQWAAQVVNGSDEIFSHKLREKHKSALIVSTEDDKQAISYLIKKQNGSKPGAELRNLFFIFEFERLHEELDVYLSETPLDLIIIDCFADVYCHDLKDTQRIRTFLNEYKKLSAKHNCFILFLHHTSKRTENTEPNKNNVLAGQGFESAMRLVIELRADYQNVLLRHLCIVKANYLPAAMKRESYVLHFDEQSFKFSYTGERCSFELLAKPIINESDKAKYEQAKELVAQGMTYEEIASRLGYSSKGSVTKLIQRNENNAFPVVSSGNK